MIDDMEIADRGTSEPAAHLAISSATPLWVVERRHPSFGGGATTITWHDDKDDAYSIAADWLTGHLDATDPLLTLDGVDRDHLIVEGHQQRLGETPPKGAAAVWVYPAAREQPEFDPLLLADEIMGSLFPSAEEELAQALAPPIPEEFDTRPGPRWLLLDYVGDDDQVGHASLAPIGERRLRQAGLLTLCRTPETILHTRRKVFDPTFEHACHTCALVLARLPKVSIEPTKICATCGVEKPLLDGFEEAIRYRDLSLPTCRSCTSKQNATRDCWKAMSYLRDRPDWWPADQDRDEWHVADAIAEIHRWFPPAGPRPLRCPDGHPLTARAVADGIRLVCAEGHVGKVTDDLIKLGATLGELGDDTLRMAGLSVPGPVAPLGDRGL